MAKNTIQGEDGKTYVEKKKGKGCLMIVGVVILLAIIASLFGGDKEEAKNDTTKNDIPTKVEEKKTEPKKEEQNYSIGQDVTVGKLGVKVNSVEEKTEFTSDNEFIDPVKTEGKFVVVDATLTNNDKEARAFSSTQFKLIDSEGKEYETLTDANLMMILGDKDLFFENCNPGMSRTGVFVFETPTNVTDYKLKVLGGVAFKAGDSVIINVK